MALSKSFTKEQLEQKTEKELLEMQVAYATESNNYLRKINASVLFFLWIFIITIIVSVIFIIENTRTI